MNHKVHKTRFDLDIKYSREHFSKEEVRESIERILREKIGDRFGAYSAVRKVEIK